MNTKKSNFDKGAIVGMGEALWDVFPEGKKIGGAPANFAYHVSQFEFDSCVVSAVGDDELGNEILDNFASKKLRCEIAKVSYPTGIVQIELGEEGIPRYNIKENVAWDNIPYTDNLKKLANNTRSICFGSLAQRSIVSQNAINQFLDQMPEGKDVLKIFDINLRQHFYSKETLCASFEKCNLLKINDEELEIVSQIFGFPNIPLEDKCRKLVTEYHLKMLVLTCGADCSYVFSNGDISHQKTPKVPVQDTVGAGDSFTATFVASILSGKSITQAHKLAVEVSAYVCTQEGAMPLLPQELIDRVVR